jgi:hypothetical protein
MEDDISRLIWSGFLLSSRIFPVPASGNRHFKNPTASSFDTKLAFTLKQFDERKTDVFLCAESSQFISNKKWQNISET